MAVLTIRKLDESIKAKLRVRAAKNNRSMEDEVRCILREALIDEVPSGKSFVASIQQRFRAAGGLELELPAREAIRRQAELE